MSPKSFDWIVIRTIRWQPNYQGAIVLAFLFSSVVFGLAHATNPSSTIVSTFNIVVAGLLIGLPYLLTGELGASIGLHLTSNLFQGIVYGMAVSGDLPTTHLFSIQQTGPNLWTGGALGPEGGLICLVWAIVGCGLTLLSIKRLRNIYHYMLHWRPIFRGIIIDGKFWRESIQVIMPSYAQQSMPPDVCSPKFRKKYNEKYRGQVPCLNSI